MIICLNKTLLPKLFLKVKHSEYIIGLQIMDCQLKNKNSRNKRTKYCTNCNNSITIFTSVNSMANQTILKIKFIEFLLFVKFFSIFLCVCTQSLGYDMINLTMA